MQFFKKLSLIALIAFYLLAGINHFRSPDVYYSIMPAQLPFAKLLNALSGAAEIVLALLMIRPRTRKVASYGIILMLLAFIPVHTKMVMDAPFQLGTLTVSPAVAWLRLLVFQPLLIVWAGWHSKVGSPQSEKSERRS
ncbi:DoxX family protein [Mucilaginibacter pedocola]|uniref:DoxX family protein n=1 Tax=Mucilaginibacter pedocola TaxID=1792845 RepID=A0A1S9PH25_9SPHI|nr:hypothetical protein [Mucilaginibacter pedocola]OOQ60272.1 hypothetical protein BC343_26315 [Mucilaginibacter pedocola]